MYESLVDQLKNKELTLEDRYSAILALIKFYNDYCFNILKEVLDDPEEPAELRSATALALGKLGEQSLIELKKYLAHEDPVFRNYVIQAMGMIGEKALPLLINALKDNNNEVFYSAADAIGSIGSPAVPYLTKILETCEAPDAKCVAAWKLGEIKDTSSIPALINAVKDENNNKDILALSIWALGEVSRKNRNNKSIISTLYRASRSKNPEIKRHAYIALRKARDYVN